MSVFLTLEQVSARLHTPIATIQYWVSIRKLPSFKPGRHRLVKESDLVAFVEASGTDAVRADRVKRARHASKVKL